MILSLGAETIMKNVQDFCTCQGIDVLLHFITIFNEWTAKKD